MIPMTGHDNPLDRAELALRALAQGRSVEANRRVLTECAAAIGAEIEEKKQWHLCGPLLFIAGKLDAKPALEAAKIAVQGCGEAERTEAASLLLRHRAAWGDEFSQHLHYAHVAFAYAGQADRPQAKDLLLACLERETPTLENLRVIDQLAGHYDDAGFRAAWSRQLDALPLVERIQEAKEICARERHHHARDRLRPVAARALLRYAPELPEVSERLLLIAEAASYLPVDAEFQDDAGKIWAEQMQTLKPEARIAEAWKSHVYVSEHARHIERGSTIQYGGHCAPFHIALCKIIAADAVILAGKAALDGFARAYAASPAEAGDLQCEMRTKWRARVDAYLPPQRIEIARSACQNPAYGSLMKYWANDVIRDNFAALENPMAREKIAAFILLQGHAKTEDVGVWAATLHELTLEQRLEASQAMLQATQGRHLGFEVEKLLHAAATQALEKTRRDMGNTVPEPMSREHAADFVSRLRTQRLNPRMT